MWKFGDLGDERVLSEILHAILHSSGSSGDAFNYLVSQTCYRGFICSILALSEPYNQGVSEVGAWGIVGSYIVVCCIAYCMKQGILSFSHSEGKIYQLSPVEMNRLHPLTK